MKAKGLCVGMSCAGDPTLSTGQLLGEEDAPVDTISIVSNSLLLREGLPRLFPPSSRRLISGSYTGHPPQGTPPSSCAQHIVLIDAGLGLQVTLAWVRYWRSQPPAALVIVVEMPNDPNLIVACIEAGASGYTLLGASAGEVVDVIQCVRQGLAQCSPEVTAHLFARLQAQSVEQPRLPALASLLTAREIEVLRYVAQDLSNQEIATILVIEVRTVKHHVHNILEKLRCRHRWDAARLAHERGWLDAEP